MLSKAERDLPPERERERERFTDLYHDCNHANKAMVSPEKMSCLFFMTSNTEIDRVERP